MIGHVLDDYQDLVQDLALHAPQHDAEGSFPAAAFQTLHARGLLADPPRGRGEIGRMLSLLSAVGRGDLSVGRLFEGHINALSLLDRFATTFQRTCFHRQTAKGRICGVWNTDAGDNPLHLSEGHLFGAKSFASGIDGLSAAIVTVEQKSGRQMLLVPRNAFRVDRSWWRMSGMRASGSHVAELDGWKVEPHAFLGNPGDYVAEPWFSGGALRFVAVQAGGVHAIFDCVVDHLRATGRGAQPYQAHRLARLGSAVETAYAVVERVGRAWEVALADEHDARASAYFVAATQMARGVVEDQALLALETSERAVGAAGFNAPHPLERLARDLRVYLRQPNPDGALAGFGAAIEKDEWTPSFPGVQRRTKP